MPIRPVARPEALTFGDVATWTSTPSSPAAGETTNVGVPPVVAPFAGLTGVAACAAGDAASTPRQTRYGRNRRATTVEDPLGAKRGRGASSSRSSVHRGRAVAPHPRTEGSQQDRPDGRGRYPA